MESIESIQNVQRKYYRKDRNTFHYLPTEIVNCPQCGETKIVNKRYEPAKLRFCSRRCSLKYYGFLRRGKSNPKIELPIDIIKYKYQHGEKIKYIAKELGVDKSTIKRRIRYNNISRYPKEEIIKDYLDGTTQEKLGFKYKLGTYTINKILLEAGLPLKIHKYNPNNSFGKSDTAAYNQLIKLGIKSVRCCNVCLDNKTYKMPLEICKICPIKEYGKLNKMSYFDIITIKDNKFYITEVKSQNDTFSFNQTLNLLKLKEKKINICLIQTGGKDNEIRTIDYIEN